MAAVIGLAATLLALGVATLGGAGATALEWSVYDRGVFARGAAPVSPALRVVARDPASEARFGAGSWDRAVLARLITSLSRAGAAAIGFDVPIGQPSAPGRGGASSDALLSQATALTNAVVYPISLELTRAAPLDGHLAAHRSWLPGARMPLALPAALPFAGPLPGLAQHARAVGHTLAAVDPDGVVRRVPVFVRLDDAAVPAFGLALAMAVMDGRPDQVGVARGGVGVPQPGSGLAPGRIPLDGRGRALVSYAAPQRLNLVSFLDIWTAIDERRVETLQRLVDGKIVLVLAEPARGQYRTPVGPMSDVLIQAQLLNAVLAGSWLREAPLGWTLLGALVVAGLTAWLCLALSWWKALGGVAVLTAGYVVALLLSPSLIGVLLPAGLPLRAGGVAAARAPPWDQLGAPRLPRPPQGGGGRSCQAPGGPESPPRAVGGD